MALDEWQNLTAAEREACRLMAFNSLIGFIRVMFRFVKGEKFQVNWHHRKVCKELEAVYFGENDRLILNLAPGGTKTEIVSIHFPAWTIFREYERARADTKATGVNHRYSTRHLPTSYSSDLVKLNTGHIRDILLSEPFQYMCPVVMGRTRTGEGDWRVVDPQGGTHEAYSVSIAGQVTGRRAGFLRTGYSGALIIDDPMPPRDMKSFTKKDEINKNLNRVLRNRLQHDGVPIIMVQQRIAIGDQTDFLMSDKSLDKYRLVKIPAMVTREYANTLSRVERAEMIAATGFSGEPVSYWDDQVKTSFLKGVQVNDPFLFTSQYQQAPDEAMLEGQIFGEELRKAHDDGRIGEYRIDKAIPVDTYWDIGVRDLTTIWLAQSMGPRRRIIGCYGNNNLSIEHYLQWLVEFRQKFRIVYGTHYGPHDLANRGKLTAITDLEVAERAGISFELVKRPVRKSVPIQATKRIFDMLEFSEESCLMDPVNPIDKQKDRWGMAGLRRYRRTWDPENEVFSQDPVHDWASHWADAFMLIGQTYIDEEPASGSNEPTGSAWSM